MAVDAGWEWPESHRDLVEALGVGVLATVGPSGMPQVTAVAYRLGDDGLPRLSLRADRQKVKNISASPKATLFLMDPADVRRTIEIRATVQLTPDEGNTFAAQFATNSDHAPNASGGPPSRYVATLHPERVNLRTSSGTTSVPI